MKNKIMKLCGNKIIWNDCILTGARIVRTLRRFRLTEFEKRAIRLWAEDDSKQVIFVENVIFSGRTEGKSNGESN